ncbi:hypothetical protein AB0K60_32505 [Thermopolyspora sp. NPDC052614]|uniref:hypothetical protein n=1 Tax=Thermopolyspora sp. NPDC052614 TaxID=3155682 RepID=UPI00344AA80F
MSLTMKKRRVDIVVPTTRLDQIKTQATRAAGRVGPMAAGAREIAAHTVDDARVWAAPRLERAAHAVEEQIAPRVSAMLSDAAKAVNPRKSVRSRRRWPVLTLVTGVALGAVGYLMYRNNQQWADTMRETGMEAGERIGEKAAETGRKAAEAGERLAEKTEKTTDPRRSGGKP